MVVELRKSGYIVNRKRVQRLMRKMGISAIYPKRSLSQRNKAHKIYPYLLKDVKIDTPNFVWSTDITYIQLREGFLYLVAIIDWYSRYVLSWRLSNTLDVSFCLEALEEALSKGTPAIFNSDQGSQFTSKDFTQILLDKGIKISMDGRGRVFDNIFIERLWRSVKYENVYLKGYETCEETIDGLGSYFPFYNNQRPHQALGYKVPHEVHYD
jgi:putative transposase